jgi:hypothetical protein
MVVPWRGKLWKQNTQERLLGKQHGSQYSRRELASISATAAGEVASWILWTENRQQVQFTFMLAPESASISYYHDYYEIAWLGKWIFSRV